MYKHFFKRIIDFVVSLTAIIILSPFIIVITIWLHFANKGAGAFFLQERPGKDGKSFNIIKYKTMTDECDMNGNLLPDAERLTRAGHFVRSLSIDELPQLINVLKANMSLIGPRPLLLYYLSYYTKEQARRHEVLPGITGLAQVHSRNALMLSKKFKYDVFYADHCSLCLDIRILLKTIKKIFLKENIGEGGAQVMENVDDLGITRKLLKYGCEYNEISDYPRGKSIPSIYPHALYYANCRQAIVELVKKYNISRLWIPGFYNYEVIDYIKMNSDCKIIFYNDSPLSHSDRKNLEKKTFLKDDAILRINYFGFRKYRNNKNIKALVIEDHSHSLISEWAQKSNADFCVASLRKTMPIAEGGILWSPLNKALPEKPNKTKENETLARKRVEAMKLKSDLLIGKNKDRSYLKKLYLETEKQFSTLPCSLISEDSMDIVKIMDIAKWDKIKKRNWKTLQKSIKSDKVKILQPETDLCNPFSLILKFKNHSDREKVRENLIKRQRVFSLILWTIPDYSAKRLYTLGECILSINCDARYKNDLEDLGKRIQSALNTI